MTYDQLREDLTEEMAMAIIAERHDDYLEAPEGEHTDEEWDLLSPERQAVDNFAEDQEFTRMANDIEYMNTLSDTERQCVLRWAEVEALRDRKSVV